MRRRLTQPNRRRSGGPSPCRGIALGRHLLAALAGGLLAAALVARGEETTVVEAASNGVADFDLGDGFDDIDLLELEVPVVVTASRRAQRITSVPQAMTVITAEDIRRSGARTIGDAVRLAAGVDVADLSMQQQAVSIRGSHGFLANTILVLVDGRQIFDSVYGGTVWNSWPFNLEDIERIEVQRGPAGVTWGANAMNGVINIITKDPADQLGFNLSASAASRGTVRQYFGYGLKDDKLRLRVSGAFDRTDGFREGGNLIVPLDDRENAGSFTLHGIYDSSPRHQLEISAGAKLVDGGIAHTIFTWPHLQSPLSESYYLLGRWRHHRDEDDQEEVTAYVNSFHGMAGTDALDYLYHQFALQYMRTVRPDADHTVTWGIDTRLDLVDTTNAAPFMLTRDRVNSGIIGAYLQDEWRFAPRWTLNLGARVDYDTYGGFQPSARAALAYELAEASAIYASVARSFAMPPAGARFFNFPLTGGLAYVTSDQDLAPRKLLAYELGYRGRLWDRLDLSANLFWHEYADYLALPLRLGPPGLIRTEFTNVGDASAYGFELESRFRVTERLELLANYTFENFDWRSDTPYHLTDFMTPPEHKATLGARYDLTDDVHLSTHLYYVDAVLAPQANNIFAPRAIDSYLRWDVRAEWEFWDDRASLAAGMRNLLDGGHAEGGTVFIGDGEAPRMFFTELRIAIPAGDP